MSRKERDAYVISGWIRENTIKLNINIPDEITKECFIWYHLTHKILTFSDKYQTIDAWKFNDDKTCAIRKDNVRYHAYITPKCKKVSSGIHCWRVYTINPNKLWIGWFIGEANKSFTNDSYADDTGNDSNDSCIYSI